MLVAAAILSQTALNLVRPLISYKALALGGDAFAVGLISAAFAILPIVVALWMGRQAAKVGRLKPLIMSGLTLVALSCWLLSLAGGLLPMALASATLGLGHMAFTVAGQSAITRLAGPARIDASFGWFTASFSVGQLIGPLLAGWLLGQEMAAVGRIDDINRALMLAGWIALLAVPSVLIRFASQRPEDDPVAATGVKVKPDSVMTILSQPGVKSNMLSSLALLATVDILVAFLPLMAEDHGIAPSIVGVLLALRAAASILSRMLLTVLLRRWSRDQLVAASLAGAAVGLAVLPFVFDIFWLAALSLIVGGFFLGLGQPVTMALMTQAVRAESRSAALAIRILGNRAGQVLLPATAGLLAAPLGASGAVWMASLLLGALVATASRNNRARRGLRGAAHHSSESAKFLRHRGFDTPAHHRRGDPEDATGPVLPEQEDSERHAAEV